MENKTKKTVKTKVVGTTNKAKTYNAPKGYTPKIVHPKKGKYDNRTIED